MNLFWAVFLPLSLFFTSWAAASMRPGDFMAQGPTTKKEIALTFDDGPGPETPQFLDELDRYGVKATFFMLGEQVKRWPREAREVVQRGQDVGNHTYHHVNYLRVFNEYRESESLGAEERTIQDLLRDVRKTQAIISGKTGLTPRLCRMPHGVDRSWVNAAAKEAGLILVNWSFGADWVKKPMRELRANYLKAIRPGAILLFHDGGGGREKSLALLRDVLDECERRGYQVVPLQKWVGE